MGPGGSGNAGDSSSLGWVGGGGGGLGEFESGWSFMPRTIRHHSFHRNRICFKAAVTPTKTEALCPLAHGLVVVAWAPLDVRIHRETDPC